MCRLVLLCVILGLVAVNAAVLKSATVRHHTGRIVGGENAVIETYPYQVSLQVDDEHACGGSIISEYWVITAGHCIHSFTVEGQVRAGATFHNKGGSLHNIVRVIVHEKYESRDDGVPVYDIALIEVNEPFMFDDTRQPIELFKARGQTLTGAWAIVTGWGVTDNESSPEQLQSVAMPLLSTDICRAAYGDDEETGLPNGQICAGYLGEGGKDSCQGDSGGPMAINGRLAGIVSWGQGCGEADYPGVYTEVAYFRDWIKSHVGF